MSTTKGTEELNEQGAIETKVETTDYRSPAGEDREPRKEKAGVVHLTRNKGSGGVLASAANAVSKTLQSVKDTVWGSGKK